ncbi:hypothetical protein HJG54_17740 [Leptolyngbya sp. NK1-12]|uniref:Uncharacterized protein n=1 Tax=Leptolyngbya sp. NK1-12 TaxID=2547451 RepID=A0AA97AQZ7_9CYAN|nr:hypothetical protein [Leptolyngbya sp. NK1-12]WNZ24513.1 hypothetical protein HJG54_17740 [Leptolyngbya sp. NK1-12]
MTRKSAKSVLTVTILFLLSIGAGVVIGHSESEDEITRILGAQLPESATEIDYKISRGWDGPSLFLCARMSKPEFLRYVEEIRIKKQSEGKLVKQRYRQSTTSAFSHSKFLGLSCWFATPASNQDTYVLFSPKNYFMVIRYQNETMFVSFSSQ